MTVVPSEQFLSAIRSETFIVDDGEQVIGHHRRSTSDRGPSRKITHAGSGKRHSLQESNRSYQTELSTSDTGSLAQERALFRARRAAKSTTTEDSLNGELEEAGGHPSSDIDRSSERPHSAWKGHSGRRPNFTFTDVDDQDIEAELDIEEDQSSSRHRRTKKSNADDSDEKDARQRHRRVSCSVVLPANRSQKMSRSGHRSSLIPVSVDRLGDDDDLISPADDSLRRRRHSVFAVHYDNNSTSSSSHINNKLVVTRTQSHEPQHHSVPINADRLAPDPKSFRDRALTDGERLARMRILARLAGMTEPTDDDDVDGGRAGERQSRVAPLPRKLEPLFVSSRDSDRGPASVDDEPQTLKHASSSSVGNIRQTKASDFYGEVLGAVDELILAASDTSKPRPLIGRKAKAMLLSTGSKC